jgi:hypothetical protein
MNTPNLQQANQESTNEQPNKPAFDAAGLGAPAPAKTNGAAKGPDPFDINKLVLTQSFSEAVGAEEVISRITIRKPNKQEWFRVHPDPEFRKNLGVIELKGDNEFYFVHPDLIAALSQWCFPATLYAYVDSTVNPLPRLWPIRLPKENEADMDWWSSARGIADYAMDAWTQMWSDKSGGMYRYRGTEKLKDKQPDWRGLTAGKMYEIAVQPRYIATLDHPVAMKLLTGA